MVSMKRSALKEVFMADPVLTLRLVSFFEIESKKVWLIAWSGSNRRLGSWCRRLESSIRNWVCLPANGKFLSCLILSRDSWVLC